MRNIFYYFLLTIICLNLLVGCDNIKHNNTKSKNELISESYSISQITNLKEKISSSSLSFTRFKKEYSTQCTRKTHQGYYVILKQEDGQNAFVFINKDLELYDLLIIDDFKTKEEFENQVAKFSTKSEIIQYDTNTIFSSFSSVETTIHIIQEGVIIIKYSRLSENGLLSDPIIANIDFIDNQSLMEKSGIFWDTIPYILEFDKTG